MRVRDGGERCDQTCSPQALKCDTWPDGAPTQVEEDLWYDSLLLVNSPRKFSIKTLMWCLFAVLSSSY